VGGWGGGGGGGGGEGGVLKFSKKKKGISEKGAQPWGVLRREKGRPYDVKTKSQKRFFFVSQRQKGGKRGTRGGEKGQFER